MWHQHIITGEQALELGLPVDEIADQQGAIVIVCEWVGGVDLVQDDRTIEPGYIAWTSTALDDWAASPEIDAADDADHVERLNPDVAHTDWRGQKPKVPAGSPIAKRLARVA